MSSLETSTKSRALTMLTFQEFVDILASTSQTTTSPVEETIDRIRAEQGRGEFEDDVSIIEVTF